MSDPTLPQLLQWFDLCALQNCDSATQTSLSEWGGRIFLNQVRRVYPRSELLKSSFLEAWWEFEAICHEKARGEGATGNAWKKHLLRAAQAAGKDEEAQRVILLKMLCIRLKWEATAIAKDERDEREGNAWRGGGVGIIPGDRPVSDDADSPTFAELISNADHGGLDPACEAADKELDEIARREARDWFKNEMSMREKLALGCKHAGRPLTDPTVLSEADVEKSVFFDCFRRFVRRLAESLQEKYAGEDLQTVRELVYRVLRELGRLCEAVLPPEDLQGVELGKVEQATPVQQPENPRGGSL